MLQCEPKPFIEGEVVDDKVILSYESADNLRKWIEGMLICKDSNIVILEGYIEKLENRLKAIAN
jgi:hypothetical protein